MAMRITEEKGHPVSPSAGRRNRKSRPVPRRRGGKYGLPFRASRRSGVFFFLTCALLTQASWGQGVGSELFDGWEQTQTPSSFIDGTAKTIVESTLTATLEFDGTPSPPATVDYTIDTMAGPGNVGDGGAATAAWLRSPGGVAVDGAGNLYIADSWNNRIRKVNAAGVITTVAGDGTRGFVGDGGPAATARLAFPVGVAVDGAGNLYIADRNNNRIRKVNAAGFISTVAGDGTWGFSGDGGPATAAQLRAPSGVAVDGAGNLYIADRSNHRIRKVDAAGFITTAAGGGSFRRRRAFPVGVAVDGVGNLYIADSSNNRVRKVDAAGFIATVAGDGTPGFVGDGGWATAAWLLSPSGVAVDRAGNLYIADSSNQRIRKVDAAGVIATVAGDGTAGFGGDGGPAASARLRFPRGVAVDGAGNLYIADSSNNRVRKVNAAGILTTAAGDGTAGFGGDGGPAASARLFAPEDVAIDGAGNLYIADRNNHRIRKIDAAGFIATAAGDGTAGFGGDGGPAASARLLYPQSMAVDGAGNLYIADTDNHRVRKVDAAGFIATVAGDGTAGFGGDGGPAAAAQLRFPRGVAVDGAGSLYIADSSNHRIRKVDAAGVIATVAGDRTWGFSGDGGPAAAAQLRSPRGVAVDGAGNLYIADTGNQRIRKVDAAGVITTVAGDGTAGFGGDGGPAAAAQLRFPRGVAVDGAGNLYIADRDNNRIRKVNAAGVIATAAGDGTFGFGGDGWPAAAAQLWSPSGVAVDRAGNLYIADLSNHRIRKATPSTPLPPPASPTATLTASPGSITRGESATLQWSSTNAASARIEPGIGLVAASGSLRVAPTATTTYTITVTSADGRTAAASATVVVNAPPPPPAGSGTIATVAGNGTHGFSGDGGPATAAQLDDPQKVAVDGAGNLYIADSHNQRIRKVDAAGVISTVAGDGRQSFRGDGGPATAAWLHFPSGVAVDGAGNLYIADSGNHRIRKVDAAGVITTVAGGGSFGFGGDGGPATAAQLSSPRGVAVDGAGNLYIADTFNHRIRKVDAAGVISTAAGNGMLGFGGDGEAATAAQLAWPGDVAVDGAGNLYIADISNRRIRKVTFSTSPPGTAPRISAGGIVTATGTPVVNRISPNAIVSIFGQELAPQGTQAASPRLDASGKIAANLAATCLEIDGRRAPLFAVFPAQINAQVPHDLAPGQSRVQVIRGCGAEAEQPSPAATVAIAAVSPAFFNLQNNPDGRNPLAALHGGGPGLVGAPGAIPGLTLTPAEPGEVVTLFGTGFGATEPPLEAGRIPGGAAELASAVSLAIGGIAVPPEDVFYAGAAPCCAGLYQFTVRVPPGLSDGDAPVMANVRGVSTPAGPFLAVRRR